MTNPMKCKCGETVIMGYQQQWGCGFCGISGPYDDPDHVGWDALMGGSAAPKDGTVRVRIPVHLLSRECFVVNWSKNHLYPEGRDDAKGDFIAHITADIPLPTPAEVKGDVS